LDQDKEMSRFLSFAAGAISGALVGGVLTILFTPASGDDLKAGAEARWNAAVYEANRAREEKLRELETEFEMSKAL
jgi:gas vesicle protein